MSEKDGDELLGLAGDDGAKFVGHVYVGRPLALPDQIDDAAEQGVNVYAANWYGEESRSVEMNVPRAIRPTDEEVMHG